MRSCKLTENMSALYLKERLVDWNKERALFICEILKHFDRRRDACLRTKFLLFLEHWRWSCDRQKFYYLVTRREPCPFNRVRRISHLDFTFWLPIVLKQSIRLLSCHLSSDHSPAISQLPKCRELQLTRPNSL